MARARLLRGANGQDERWCPARTGAPPAAQEHWISRIDAKASVVLAFEGALVVLALTRQLLGTREGALTVATALGLVGIGRLIAGIVCSAIAVLPALALSAQVS